MLDYDAFTFRNIWEIYLETKLEKCQDVRCEEHLWKFYTQLIDSLLVNCMTMIELKVLSACSSMRQLLFFMFWFYDMQTHCTFSPVCLLSIYFKVSIQDQYIKVPGAEAKMLLYL